MQVHHSYDRGGAEIPVGKHGHHGGDPVRGHERGAPYVERYPRYDGGDLCHLGPHIPPGESGAPGNRWCVLRSLESGKGNGIGTRMNGQLVGRHGEILPCDRPQGRTGQLKGEGTGTELESSVPRRVVHQLVGPPSLVAHALDPACPRVARDTGVWTTHPVAPPPLYEMPEGRTAETGEGLVRSEGQGGRTELLEKRPLSQHELRDMNVAEPHRWSPGRIGGRW